MNVLTSQNTESVDKVNFLQLLGGDNRFLVPHWQRKYIWDTDQITRLIDDLIHIASPDNERAHFGGIFLTVPERTTVMGANRHLIVDGQQRLTTISILLICIAEKLGDDGKYADWTASKIRALVINPVNAQTPLKLQLQQGDEREYQNIVNGNRTGGGCIARAYRVLQQQVRSLGPDTLIRGLEKFRVVNVEIDSDEDPQQVFESLNATGTKLKESEKVKNWLLMDRTEREKNRLYERYWREMERELGADQSAENIDRFLLHLVRWWAGESTGKDRVYETMRRGQVWKQRGIPDRVALLQELSRLARLYGFIAGTNESHGSEGGFQPSDQMKRHLGYLRAMKIDTHRPLTLRLLDDAEQWGERFNANEVFAPVIETICTWITRLWLADRSLNSLGRTFAEFAKTRYTDEIPGAGEISKFWVKKIRALRSNGSRVAVPDNESVTAGIGTRPAYGGSATDISRAVLCAMMEHENIQEAPRTKHLHLEHIMPQNPGDEWKRLLESEAFDFHGKWINRLANLTLIGGDKNAEAGARGFEEKKLIYSGSLVGMTRGIEKVDAWNEDTLKKRSEDIAKKALAIWEWEAIGSTEPVSDQPPMRWRIQQGVWQSEQYASRMLVSVSAKLLSLDPKNADILSGANRKTDLIRESQLPDERRAHYKRVPGSHGLWIYTNLNARMIANRCREFGNRCNVEVEVEHPSDRAAEFWEHLRKSTRGVPNQKEWGSWDKVVTRPLNSAGDQIGITIDNGMCWMYVAARGQQKSFQRAERMRRHSQMLRQRLGDQEFADDIEENAEKGISISIVLRSVAIEDESAWSNIASWISDQSHRIQEIIADEAGGPAAGSGHLSLTNHSG